MSVARANAPAPISATPRPAATAAAGCVRSDGSGLGGDAPLRTRAARRTAVRPCAGRGEAAVGLGSFLDREAVRRQLARRDAAGGDELEERLHVALLGPADVAGRQVASALLVVAVVAAGAVRARHAELELLLVHRARGRRRSGSRRRRRSGRGRARAARASPSGSGEADEAQSRTASRPSPPVAARTAVCRVEVVALEGAARRRAGELDGRRGRGRSRRRWQPAAARMRTASWPTRPSPITPTQSPIPASLWRTPCSAIAPTVAYAASSSATPSGTGAARLRGTATISAWFAQPPPPQATRSPGARPSTPAPTSSTTPADEYPSGASAASRSRATPIAAETPSTRARSTTFLTRSGRARAFWTRLFSPHRDLRALGAGADQREAVGDEQPARAEGRRRRIHYGDATVARRLGYVLHLGRLTRGRAVADR